MTHSQVGRETGLPDGWCWTTVDQVGEVRLGRQRSPKKRSKNYPTKYIRAANITEQGLDLSDVLDMEFEPGELATYRLLAGDLVLSEASGSPAQVGKPAVWRGEIDDCCFQNTVIRVRPTLVESDYALWVFKHFYASGVFARAATGVGINHLGAQRLAALPFPLAPLGMQRRMADKLDELFTDLDAGVAALERVERNLERYRASVLKAAVEGKLTEAWRAEHPHVEPASDLLARILAERRRRWEADQLANYEAKGKKPAKGWRDRYPEPNVPMAAGDAGLPRGWCWACWDQIAFSQNGRAFPSRYYQANGVRLLRPGNMHASGRVVWTKANTRRLPEEFLTEHSRHVLRSGDIVMNLSAQSLKEEFLGRACMLSSDDEPSLLNQRIARLTPILLAPRYALWLLKSRGFRRYVDGLNTGSLIQHMFTSQLAEFCFPLPPLGEQEEIALAVESVWATVEHVGRTVTVVLDRRHALRQAILKQAFEGRLVSQDRSDEPAAELLERIHSARDARSTRGPKKAGRRKGR